MSWKDEVARQIRDNKWERVIGRRTGDNIDFGLKKTIKVAMPIVRSLSKDLVPLIGNVNIVPFCGADPWCMEIEGFECKSDGLAYAYFEYRNEPFMNPIDSVGNHLRPPIDFDATFAKLSTLPDSLPNSRPG